MKSYATFFLIAVMSLGLVFLLATRDRSKHDAPAEIIEAPKPDPTAADGGVADARAPDGAVLVATNEAGVPVAAGEAGAKPGAAPLRVVTLGWELSAAAAAMPSASVTVPNGAGTTPIEVAPETALDAIEGRLAKGGGVAEGADVAIVPLPSLVASFERIRALEPKVFLVVGFSRGREEMHANAGALSKAPPAADEVKLVALGPATASDATAKAAGSESATLLGLFALDLLGAGPSRVRFVAPGTADAKAAPFAAIVKGATDERKLALSTADASHLVPIVAVAPKGVIEKQEAVLREWSKAWLDGLIKAKADVPGIARKLATKDNLPLAANVGGAPEALVLVERLGQIENVSLEQESSLIGPLAKGAVTLDNLTTKTWTLARGAGLTTSAAPDPLPIDAKVVSMIAPPPKDVPAPTPEVAADGGTAATFGPVPTGAVSLVTYRAVEGDNDKVASQLWFLSGVFDRAVFKISAKGGAKAAATIATAAKDKGIPASRLATSAAEPTGVFASVEILTPP